MDEPTAALGVSDQKKVLDLVNRLKSHGIGVIVISHQMHDVFSVADRLVIMRRGEKVGEASILADGFYSWKRQIWVSLIGITNDKRLGALLAASHGRPPRRS